MGNRTPDLRITRVFSCVARELKACPSFMFAGCCWWRSLAIDGSSGTSRGHGPVMRRPGSQWDGVIERLSASRKGGRSVPGPSYLPRPCRIPGPGDVIAGNPAPGGDVTWANWPCRVTSPILVTRHPPFGSHRPPVSSGIPKSTASTTRIMKTRKPTSQASQPELTRWPTAWSPASDGS